MALLDGIAADMKDFLDSNEFGKSALYTGAVDGVKTINAILDVNVLDFNPYTGEVHNPHPEAVAATSDVPNVRHKDTLVIDGVTYEVLDATIDGFGATKLKLNRTS